MSFRSRYRRLLVNAGTLISRLANLQGLPPIPKKAMIEYRHNKINMVQRNRII